LTSSSEAGECTTAGVARRRKPISPFGVIESSAWGVTSPPSRRTGWWKWWRLANIEYRETDHPSRGRTPEEEVLSRELQRHLWLAFRKLSARQQEVFTLRYVEGFSTEEVAETLRMSAGSVKRHLFRAVHQLRRSLGDHL